MSDAPKSWASESVEAQQQRAKERGMTAEQAHRKACYGCETSTGLGHEDLWRCGLLADLRQLAAAEYAAGHAAGRAAGWKEAKAHMVELNKDWVQLGPALSYMPDAPPEKT